MGLDMYLNAERFFGGYSDPQGRDQMIAVLGDERPPMCVSDASAALSFEVAYWRKANAVHRWFVENVQNGEDDCRKVDVSLDQLRDLVGLCETLLGKRDAELAEEYLPTESGFFYGSTDYDDWYWDCLQLTVDQVKPLLMWFDEDPRRAAQWDVSYRSSW